jgi:broad specificity phosphatase PhoE
MIIFMRHAHRDVVDTSFDDGLSEKGWAQCERLEKFFRRRKIHVDEIRSSPKLRCMQTAEFVSKIWGLPVHEDWNLMECSSQSEKDCRKRVIAAAEKWRAESKTLLLATHGDILDLLLRWGTQASGPEIKKGDLLIWQPSQNLWDPNPVRREEGPLT